jgi:hypothetical protein
MDFSVQDVRIPPESVVPRQGAHRARGRIGRDAVEQQASCVPASVVVPVGSSLVQFTITTVAVGANSSVTITATGGGVKKTASLTVTKFAPVVNVGE